MNPEPSDTPKPPEVPPGAGSGEWRRKAARLAKRYAVLIKEVDVLDELGAPGRDTPSERAETVDISPDGVRLVCRRSYPERSLLKLELRIPDWERYDDVRVGGTLTYPSPPFSVLATPVWSKPAEGGAEVGLRFVNIHDRHRRALKRLVNGE